MTPGILIVTAFLAVFVGMLLVARHLFRNPRLRGSATAGSGMMTAGFDEVFNPHAASARDEIAAEHSLVIETPNADPWA